MSQLLLQKEQPQECPEVFVATAALFLCCPCAAKLCNKHLISTRIHSDHFICRTWREITNSRKTEGKEFYPTGGLGKLMTDAIEVTRAQSLCPCACYRSLRCFILLSCQQTLAHLTPADLPPPMLSPNLLQELFTSHHVEYDFSCCRCGFASRNQRVFLSSRHICHT